MMRPLLTELKTDAANVALRAAAIVGLMYGFGLSGHFPRGPDR